MLYTDDNGATFYDGAIGNGREATPEEVAQYEAWQLAKQTEQETNTARDSLMLKGFKYNGLDISITKEDGDGMMQVDASFNRLKLALANGELPSNTIIQTVIHFKNGTKLPISDTEFSAFSLQFMLERGKFFI